jgi:hypothetical protein
MKFPANDQDYERAFGILELPPNASREAVEQAHRDLREVWNPERFTADERLKRRAAEQLARIEEAYELLKDYHARQDPLLEELYGKAKKGRISPHFPTKPDSNAPVPPPSLADTVFAEPASGPSKRFPLALVVVGVVIVVVLAILFLGRADDSPVPADQGAAPAVETRAPVNEPAPPPSAQEPTGEAAETASPSPKSAAEPSQAASTPLRNREEQPVPQQRSDSARPSREPGLSRLDRQRRMRRAQLLPHAANRTPNRNSLVVPKREESRRKKNAESLTCWAKNLRQLRISWTAPPISSE